MANVSYRDVRMVIGDPNRDLRVSLNSQLGQLGFPSLPQTDNLEPIRALAEENAVDLLVADPGSEIEDFYQLVRDIRYAKVGENPFVIIIAMISNPDLEKVKMAIECGIDEILTKPLTSGKIIDRILKLSKQRKPFVVTSEYIGPNRRDGHREGTMVVPEIEAPNPLKILTVGGGMPEYLEAIVAAQSVINNQAIERYVFQIKFLVDRVMPKYRTGSADPSVSDDLGRMATTAADIEGRLAGSRHAHVSGLCKAMRELATRMLQAPASPDLKDLELMPKISQAINLAVTADAKDAAIAQDISASVARA